jgi:hypothetical protein
MKRISLCLAIAAIVSTLTSSAQNPPTGMYSYAMFAAQADGSFQPVSQNVAKQLLTAAGAGFQTGAQPPRGMYSAAVFAQMPDGTFQALKLDATGALIVSGSGGGGGGGNTTSTALTTNFFAKSSGANSIVNSSVSDDGTNVTVPEPLKLAGPNNGELDLAYTGIPSPSPPPNSVQWTVDGPVPIPYKIPYPVSGPTSAAGIMNCATDPCQWVAGGGGGGGGGAVAQIAQVVVTSPVATMAFSSIPGTYTNLKLVIRSAATSTLSDNLYIAFNGDTAANYNSNFCYISSGTAACSAAPGSAPPADIFCPVPFVTSFFGTCTVEIASYASTVGFKNLAGTFGEHNALNVPPLSGTTSVDWVNSTPQAITSIILGLSSGHSFIVGTVATLYGEQ